MAAEQAHPADLSHAQERLAILHDELRATLEDTLHLTSSGQDDAAVIRLDEQRRALDDAMDELARDLSGLALVKAAPRRAHRWPLYAVAAVAAVLAVAISRT